MLARLASSPSSAEAPAKAKKEKKEKKEKEKNLKRWRRLALQKAEADLKVLTSRCSSLRALLGKKEKTGAVWVCGSCLKEKTWACTETDRQRERERTDRASSSTREKTWALWAQKERKDTKDKKVKKGTLKKTVKT